VSAASEDAAEESSRSRAAGSSFYAAMRIMPAKQREAIFEIYSFCRAVDDIADEGGPRDTQLAQMRRWRADIDAIYAGSPPSRVAGLARAVRDFGMKREDFFAVIDGMEMDVNDTIRAPDWEALDLYCDRVASAVGRLCVRIFGMDEQPGIDLARHLGRALQLTNILRDIDEDAAIGRLYLPREALREAGIETSDPAAVVVNPAVGAACGPVVARALRHFAQADAIMKKAPGKVVLAPRIMGAAYRLILTNLLRRGWAAPRAPVKTSRWRLLAIIARHLVY
jgi:squalene synthase HpnD